MIEFAAFVVTVSQLVAFHKSREILGWALCLVACVLWGGVAYERGLLWLFVQQLIIAGIAAYALNKRVPWGFE